MVEKSYSHCKACVTKRIKCDKGKPQCKNCQNRNISCRYRLKLKWGGRPYKNKNKMINIPHNTTMVNGVLVAKSGFVSTKAKMRVKEFVIAEHSSNFKKSSTKSSNLAMKRKSDVHVTSEISGAAALSQVTLLVHKSQEEGFGLCHSFIPRSRKLLCESWQYAESFCFFVKETSRFFVVSADGRFSNPFEIILPQMAMRCPVLLKLLAAFGSRHRISCAPYEEENDYVPLDELFPMDVKDRMLNRELLREGMRELMKRLIHPLMRFDDLTLASVLILASSCIFFGDDEIRWRAHVNGAELIIHRKSLLDSNLATRELTYQVGAEPHFFLRRWFTYIQVMGVLTSANSSPPTKDVYNLNFSFNLPNLEEKKRAMVQLEDIEYTSGMDLVVLSLLARVANLLSEKVNLQANNNSLEPILIRGMELDYEIVNHLEVTEREREDMLKTILEVTSSKRSTHRMTTYALLRSTNMIFGLTGVVLLRRRVLGVSPNSEMVIDLLSKVTNLISQRMPQPSCLLSSIFCCGCELIDPSLVPFRDVYMNQLENFSRRGMSSALKAKSVMERCWRSKKPWWEILEEMNMDICFAI